MKKKTNRLARMRLSLELLENIISCRFQPGKIKTNAPKDLKILSVYPDPDYQWRVVWIIVESEKFKPVLEGDAIPVLPPFVYTVVGD